MSGTCDLSIEVEEKYMVLKDRHLRDLNRIDGESMELEWKIFTGFTTLGILEEIQNFVKNSSVNKIFFMSVYSDMMWDEQGNTETCLKFS